MPASQTRLAMLRDIARYLGGHQGDISSGTATTAVLAPLVGNKVDDELNDDLLVMPDAATAADMERIITDHTGSSGSVTFATRADTTYTSETFFTIPRATWTLDELRAGINFLLGNTKRTYRYVVPMRDYDRQYALDGLSWLRNAKDVDGVFRRSCPGLLHNGQFDYWHLGTTSVPDGWTLAGANATIARQATFASYGAYEVALTRVGADATLTQNVPYQLAKQLIDGLATVAIKVRCTGTVASRVRVGINNGVDTTWSDYHSGDGEPEDLTASRVLTAAASRVQVVLSVDTGDTTGSFDFAAAVEDSAVPDSYWQGGENQYLLHRTNDQIWNIGNGVPVVSLAQSYGRKQQLVVISRRPYATLSTDSASTEADTDMVVSGTIYQLALQGKRGMDRETLDRLMAQHGPIYTSIANGLIDKPVQEPQGSAILVRGA